MGKRRRVSAFKWRQFAGEVILWAVRWYCRYGISYRELEEMLGERGVAVDHGRWKYLYRAIDKDGATLDFFLADRRNAKDRGVTRLLQRLARDTT
jgi:IS6 family transposase